jgi:RNA polymerase sigma factor (TIGR02999 family)
MEETALGDNGEVTRLLGEIGRGQQDAVNNLLPLVYDELHRLARSYFRRERGEHTMQPTALVHEAYIRLVNQKTVQWQNRAHFFGVAAQSIRHILVDHARSYQTAKRGSGAHKLSLDEAVAVTEARDIDLIALDDALTGLDAVDSQQGRIVELRFFGGLSIEETAEVLKISPATVKRDWVMAKAWLYQTLSGAA